MLSSRRLHGVSITEPSKILFPASGYTKADVTAYYDSISHYLLSHLKDRPIVSEQCEINIDKDCWRQRGANDDYPSYVHTAFLNDPMASGASHFPICQNVRALIYLTERGMLTPHLWLSRYDQPEMPDRLAFLLHAGEGQFRDICEVAYALSSLLHDQGLVPFVMTDGLGGLIVMVPIRRRGDFAQAQPFVEMMAERLVERMPGLKVKGLDGDMSEASAGDVGLWLDISRNQHGGTVVAPYALRARPDAPVAIPLDWMELSRSDLAPTRYSLRNLHARLRQKRDPWRNFSRHARTLP